MDTNKIFIDMAQRAHEFAEMCWRMAKEADPEAWREECRKKQAAGVRFEYCGWCKDTWLAGIYEFNGNKEDYREVPQEVQKDGGAKIPEAAKDVLKAWQKQGIKFESSGEGDPWQQQFCCFNERKEDYRIPEQPIPEGMSVETVEAMWRQGLVLDFSSGRFGWNSPTNKFNWNRNDFRDIDLLNNVRIPAQPIPEKLPEEPTSSKGIAFAGGINSMDKNVHVAFPEALNLPTPHAVERALWKAQREAGTNEVWITAFAKNGAACEIPVHIEPGWHDGQVYYVKPMKLTAKIIRRGVYKTSYYWEFTGTREEYRAECEKYGYVVVSNIEEVKPKTVKNYSVLVRLKFPTIEAANAYVKDYGMDIIGDIEEREIEA